MTKRLKIYFMHSASFDYNEKLYKLVLSSKKCLYHELILPYSENYQNKYAKDLINISDIIIVLVDEPNILFKFELKWVQNAKKPTIYVSLKNQIPSSLKKQVNMIQPIQDNESLLTVIENFIEENAAKEEIDINAPVNIGYLDELKDSSPGL